MIFRQLFETETSTYSYLLGCERTHRACLIDPVASEINDYVELLHTLNLKLIYTMETHVHADHITGAGLLREKLGSKSVVHRDAGALCADLMVTDGVLLQIGNLEFEVRHTPGHTSGCVSYVMADRVFTGDALLIGGSGRSDFQEGDAGQLYDSVTGKLFTLPPDTLVYPGHDYHGNTVSTIKQEIAKNTRLGGGRSRAEFIAIMQDLKLAYPKFIDQALPANQSCGMTGEQ
ncbi:MAG: MBL fold metallo-hydrolase [Methylococcaceae bacterium]|jgi:glyoxylase-like metal-dependent hydrolase (beta-lactamase superfamily II)|nr:MBL fold metallo-hydrolase [Methylococcaceae bacterium]MDZ4155625.1 MBL fold metallo-hydrolase [Methylococcales bacterium]MDP2392239.1 MBL fold metallo-hydrolase [Methylococcaceae bacterium]MDP3018241.1 MBL fold metallo-hydrolase [Methylococcaceae bacterium]MDP3389884.1 MBL fold metallo-hydrolase [Methylococcaceae bacterium]